jgi:micrococcal nuclease
VILERVIDGDTVEVRYPDDSLASVRLIGIDTPEKYGATECGSAEASAAMERRVRPGQRLRLVSDPTQDQVDHYGRLLRYVELWGSRRDLGKAQVQSGWAKFYVFESNFRRLRGYMRAQRNARKWGRGVWTSCGGRIHSPAVNSRASAVQLIRGWEDCGSSRGRFPIYGAPDLTGTVFVNARGVRCGKALRIGHKIFFGQECVYCDDPSNYSYGEHFKFKGFRCVVHRGDPQKFHCVRGSRVIYTRTDIDQI